MMRRLSMLLMAATVLKAVTLAADSDRVRDTAGKKE